MSGAVLADKPTNFDNNGKVVKTMSAGGFDEFGCNYTAMIFSGKADGVDHMLDGKVNGNPTYANDRVVMKWSKAWDDARFHGAAWTTDAWENNEWSEMKPGGSGEVWHYKIRWYGPRSDGDPTNDPDLIPEGGYCIWNQFQMLMSQGTYDGAEGRVHEWDTEAVPNGYSNWRPRPQTEVRPARWGWPLFMPEPRELARPAG